jgi:cell division protein FtsL
MSRTSTASEQGWRNNTLHREVDNSHARWVVKIMVGVAVALAPAAVYLLQTMSYVQTSYALEDVRGREAHLIEWEHRLTVEKDVLESLPEVEKHAAVRLGLEHASAAHVVVVSPGELSSSQTSRAPSLRPRPR